MQKTYVKFFALSLLCVSLLSVLGGCKKNKTTKQVTSSLSKKDKKSKKHTSSSVDPLNLDADDLQTFALTDKTLHAGAGKSAHQDGNNPMFSWEDLGAEQSKNQFKTVYFDFDKDHVKPSEEAAIAQNADKAKNLIKQGNTIVVEGHACHSAGSAAYNMALSERRARHIAQKFAQQGIDAAQIKIAPRGQEMPVQKGGNAKQQWVNRRVETYAIKN